MSTHSNVRCCTQTHAPRKMNLKILDCTIRDGGICNDWQFSPKFVQSVFQALRSAKIDYMEVGYRTKAGIFSQEDVGPWRFCHEEDLQAVLEESPTKISTMVDIGRIQKSDIPSSKDTLIDVVRIATYAHQLDEAQRILDHCLEQGYETFMNVMAVSTLTPSDIDTFLKKLSRSGTHNVAIVDSFGSLFPHHIEQLVAQYRSHLGEEINIGVHCHNNQQQALANSIAAVHAGVDFVDATLNGMGRGAGNCPLELLLLYLEEPRYDVRPLLPLLEEFANLKEELRWGYQLPYAITGHYNLHPKSGIEKMKTEERNQVQDMFDTFAKRNALSKRKIV
jgi:4-hydroxy 2-oxovalerate aldolase